ncbi:MAG: hypothetical protein ACRDYD_05300, partial [Acidimicrobiales bacterium]
MLSRLSRGTLLRALTAVGGVSTIAFSVAELPGAPQPPLLGSAPALTPAGPAAIVHLPDGTYRQTSRSRATARSSNHQGRVTLSTGSPLGALLRSSSTLTSLTLLSPGPPPLLPGGASSPTAGDTLLSARSVAPAGSSTGSPVPSHGGKSGAPSGADHPHTSNGHAPAPVGARQGDTRSDRRARTAPQITDTPPPWEVAPAVLARLERRFDTSAGGQGALTRLGQELSRRLESLIEYRTDAGHALTAHTSPGGDANGHGSSRGDAGHGGDAGHAGDAGHGGDAGHEALVSQAPHGRPGQAATMRSAPAVHAPSAGR